MDHTTFYRTGSRRKLLRRRRARVRIVAGEFAGMIGRIVKPVGEFPFAGLVGVKVLFAACGPKAYGLFDTDALEPVR